MPEATQHEVDFPKSMSKDMHQQLSVEKAGITTMNPPSYDELEKQLAEKEGDSPPIMQLVEGYHF